MIDDFSSEAAVLDLMSRQFAFPDTYLVLDTETTGFSKDRDYLIDVGWAVVQHGSIVHQDSLMLDWSRVPDADHGYIQYQLRQQADHYAQQGRPHCYPWERLRCEGEHPLEVLHSYASLIYDHITRGDSRIVGHGLWRFDRDFIDNHTEYFLDGYVLPWQPDSIIDTGLIEKACQTNTPPYPEESLDDWMYRIDRGPARVKWSLEGFCIPKYRLDERYGLDMRRMHTAEFDCVAIHHLFNLYREIVEAMRACRYT